MKIEIASLKHIKYCKVISETIAESAKVRGTGIALRSPEYIETKIRNANAIIALKDEKFAGFCYIEIWGHGKYVAHSGLIVVPEFRGIGLAKLIKKKTFEYSKKKYPQTKIFGITTPCILSCLEIIVTRLSSSSKDLSQEQSKTKLTPLTPLK